MNSAWHVICSQPIVTTITSLGLASSPPRGAPKASKRQKRLTVHVHGEGVAQAGSGRIAGLTLVEPSVIPCNIPEGEEPVVWGQLPSAPSGEDITVFEPPDGRNALWRDTRQGDRVHVLHGGNVVSQDAGLRHVLCQGHRAKRE